MAGRCIYFKHRNEFLLLLSGMTFRGCLSFGVNSPLPTDWVSRASCWAAIPPTFRTCKLSTRYQTLPFHASCLGKSIRTTNLTKKDGSNSRLTKAIWIIFDILNICENSARSTSSNPQRNGVEFVGTHRCD